MKFTNTSINSIKASRQPANAASSATAQVVGAKFIKRALASLAKIKQITAAPANSRSHLNALDSLQAVTRETKKAEGFVKDFQLVNGISTGGDHDR